MFKYLKARREKKAFEKGLIQEALEEKAYRAQKEKKNEEQVAESNAKTRNADLAFEAVGFYNRCVNMLVDSAAQVGFDIKDSLPFTPDVKKRPRKNILNSAINYKPGPGWDVSDWRRAMYADLIFEGWCFAYWDGAYFEHLPAKNMQVFAGTTNRVKKFVYQGANEVTFLPDEIFWLRDNNRNSNLQGISRAAACIRDLISMEKAEDFQGDVYDNWATIGYSVETDAALGKKQQDKIYEKVIRLTTGKGRSNVTVMPWGAKLNAVKVDSLREMSTIENIEAYKKAVSISLGIPPEMHGGIQGADMKEAKESFWNNAIIPMATKFERKLEAFFGYDIQLDTSSVRDLQMDKKTQANWLSTMVNGGIMLPEEARELARLPELSEEDMKKLRVPQNIAGKGDAANPDAAQGAPERDEDE